MGHEIGYHYKTLSEANGDPEKAINLFQIHLEDCQKGLLDKNDLHARKAHLKIQQPRHLE